MLGLIADGEVAAAKATVDNFADLIGPYGRAPKGARTYYLSRSQPPVLFLMAGLLAENPAGGWVTYLEALKREHRFWTLGSGRIPPCQARRRIAAMPDGAVLNRYWDDQAAAREESYREDLGLAARAGRPVRELFRDIRAAAESGWDFSSRWLADPADLATVQTTRVAPIDLNALLWGLERALAEACDLTGDTEGARRYRDLADARATAIDRWLWSSERGCYFDYDWRARRPIGRTSAAIVTPLFVGLASGSQADAVAGVVRSRLFRPGGVVTTEFRTGQQWDAPNGWAPLQWMAVAGLARYGHIEAAREIADRWLRLVGRVFDGTGRLLEKYDVEDSRPGGGGEYPLQDGFGWTNGVTKALLRWRADPRPSAPCVFNRSFVHKSR